MKQMDLRARCALASALSIFGSAQTLRHAPRLSLETHRLSLIRLACSNAFHARRPRGVERVGKIPTKKPFNRYARQGSALCDHGARTMSAPTLRAARRRALAVGFWRHCTPAVRTDTKYLNRKPIERWGRKASGLRAIA